MQTAVMLTSESPINTEHAGESVLRVERPKDTDIMSTTPERSYDRTWEEIETMLDRATEKMHQWKEWYDSCKEQDDKEGMKEAARNHKALQGVVKTLKWTLGEKGITDPLN